MISTQPRLVTTQRRRCPKVQRDPPSGFDDDQRSMKNVDTVASGTLYFNHALAQRRGSESQAF